VDHRKGVLAFPLAIVNVDHVQTGAGGVERRFQRAGSGRSTAYVAAAAKSGGSPCRVVLVIGHHLSAVAPVV
jgi:hypothetical protein